MEISFSKFEQEIISRLVGRIETSDRPLFKYIYDDNEYIAIEWDEDFTQVKIYFKKEDPEKNMRTWDSLCEIIFLFRKLEKNDLIGIYNNTKSSHKNAIFDENKYEKNDPDRYTAIGRDSSGRKTLGFFPISNLVFYTSLGKDIKKYSSSSVYVSQSLKVLVKDKFQTKEGIRHKFTLCTAWIAIITTTALSVVSILKTDTKNLDVLNSISKSNNDISTKLDSLNIKYLINDTLKNK